MSIIRKKHFPRVSLLVSMLLMVAIFGYLYKERYLSCISQNFSLCLQSKKYTSADHKFMFRYPANYPLTSKTGDQMMKQYGFDDKYKEWVNFSSKFYPNAGGERLGSVIVTKNTPYKNVEEYVSKELGSFDVPPKIEYTKIGTKNAACSSLSQQPHSFSPPSYDCYVVDSGLLYAISFDYNVYYHKLPVEHYQEARQLILSTFSFN